MSTFLSVLLLFLCFVIGMGLHFFYMRRKIQTRLTEHFETALKEEIRQRVMQELNSRLGARIKQEAEQLKTQSSGEPHQE